jgi:hypothetical protein
MRTIGVTAAAVLGLVAWKLREASPQAEAEPVAEEPALEAKPIAA